MKVKVTGACLCSSVLFVSYQPTPVVCTIVMILMTLGVAAQMLYLPLDGDTLDHSGIGRHGEVAAGQHPPSFTCLDKSVNCSALFTAGQCITVPSLAMVPYTSTELQAGSVAQVPKASFVVHFKRVPSGPPTKQGLQLSRRSRVESLKQ